MRAERDPWAGGPMCAVAVATAAEAGGPLRSTAEADRRASDLAALRAVTTLVGPDADIAVRHRTGRPPAVGTDSGHPPVVVSITHCDGRAGAVAAAASTRIGIDLEHLAALPPSHMRYFSTPRERRAGACLRPAALWALKEAAWKALALGDDVPFCAVELELDTRGVLRAVALRGERLPAVALLSSPWPGYVMAVVRIGARWSP